jgi:predicted nucleic acid-binding protein
VLADFIPWPFDDEAAREFGRIKADQRRAGRPIPDLPQPRPHH